MKKTKVKKGSKNVGFVNIGKCYFFRTVTYHSIGKVVAREGNWLKLEGASWVADSGRFMQAISTGILDEVEPVGTTDRVIYVNLDACADYIPWNHPLPVEQK